MIRNVPTPFPHHPCPCPACAAGVAVGGGAAPLAVRARPPSTPHAHGGHDAAWASGLEAGVCVASAQARPAFTGECVHGSVCEWMRT